MSSFLDLGVCRLPGVQVQAARLPKVYECLDENLEFIPGLAGGTGAGLSLLLVEATCNTGLQCPPYSATLEVSCAVCTK